MRYLLSNLRIRIFRFSNSWYMELLVFAIFFAFLLFVFKNTLFDIPRSDHVTIFTLFENLRLPDNISDIAFVEFFGHPRFQPLAWFISFFQVKVFGNQFVLYHLTVIGLHALNGLLVFKLLYSITRKGLFSFLAAMFFISCFTHFIIVAWPFHAYILFQVTLTLLAILCLIKFYRSSKAAFLYLTYALAFVQLFIYEANVIAPVFIFLFAVALSWHHPNRKTLILKNFALTSGIFLIYGTLYIFVINQFVGMNADITNPDTIIRSLAQSPVHFFTTATYNILPSTSVVFDELVFFEPSSPRSLSALTTSDISIVFDIFIYLVLIALVFFIRKPSKGKIVWLLILSGWGIAYTFMILLGRGLSETITQSRYAYFPALVLVVVAAFLFEPHFSEGWSLVKENGKSFLRRYRSGIIVVLACLVLIGVNTGKTYTTLDQYMEYRAYPNAIYYEALEWLSNPENQNNSLFISVPTYPPHEKLAWGTDIIPDLFLKDPRITKNYQQATHILEWNDEQQTASIRELELTPQEIQQSGDFAITFGFMPHEAVTEDYLEIFGPYPANAESGERQWWLRLDFEPEIRKDPTSDIGTGRASIVLGYSLANYGSEGEGWIFRSQPFDIQGLGMTHIVLVRQSGTFGVIINGKLIQKSTDISGEESLDLQFPLSKVYYMGYPKPYFFAYTFIELGKSDYYIADKAIEYIFKEITFNSRGFQEYHVTYGW